MIAGNVVADDSTLAKSMASWSKGIKHELGFWRNWLTARGGQWHWDFEERLKPNKAVEGFLAEILSGRPDIVNVLDVGAGPLSVVGKMVNDREIVLEATDPLADFYKILNDEQSIVPPVATKFSTAEDLSLFYDASSFDLSYCQNALDHSFDPLRAIVEMLRVVKVGGLVVLSHHENEAENEQYVGFHQFNFTERDGDFIIWNKNQSANVGQSLPVKASVEARRYDGKIGVIITKEAEFEDVEGASRYRERAGEILRSLVAHYGNQAMESL